MSESGPTAEPTTADGASAGSSVPSSSQRPSPVRDVPTAATGPRKTESPPVDGRRAYSREPKCLTSGNQIELLIDGRETFPAMLEAIEGAKRFVHVETYILANDEVGRRFAEALAERVRAGVTVRLLFDSVGSLLLPSEFVRELVEAGVDVTEFRPLRRLWFGKPWSRWSCRDHRKLMVVDGTVAFTGGLNITRDHGGFSAERDGWRDTHVRIEGPAVAQAEALFRAMWHRGGGTPYDPYPAAGRDGTADGPSLAAMVASDGGRRSIIHQHYLHAFQSARETIFLANAYFVPNRRLVRALTRAAGRGVRVAIIVPAESDVRLVQRATERILDRLLRHRVEVYQWPRTHMHAKTAVVDGAWSVVGSFNLDAISLFQNYEIVVECVCKTFAERMEAQFERDLKHCSRVTLAEWRRRPLRRRLAEWLAYQLKYWL